MKTYSIIITIILAIVVFVLVRESESNKEFKAKIERLKSTKDSLSSLIYQNNEKLSKLSKMLKSAQDNYNITKKELDKLKYEASIIIDDVVNYNDVKLDSIISNHRHIQRAKD